MKKITVFGLTTSTLLTISQVFCLPAQANFGDFMLGVGAAVGVGAIIDGNRRDVENRYRPVPPQQEYYRGVEDGVNRAKYDNPRQSRDYDRGYEEGLRKGRRY
ncbi:MAG TPA: hypothetical protein DCF68_18355 [Cyanothece sp. UBA12306]|nr:hypothetical protein [Cyanothece sp. UBA12306]